MRVKLVCLNVWHGGMLLESALAFLRAERPDIVCLQEAYHSPDPKAQPRLRTLEALGPALGLAHSAFAPAARRLSELDAMNARPVAFSPPALFGNAILSRFPLTAQPTRFFDAPYDDAWVEGGPASYERFPRALQHAIADLGERRLHLFNVHGIWGEHGGDTERRLAMSTVISEAVRGKAPAVLCGDFNVNEGTETMKAIGSGLNDVFKGERKTSFNVSRKPKGSGYFEAVVDFVFTTPGVRVLAHRSPAVDVSDHLPLVVELDV